MKVWVVTVPEEDGTVYVSGVYFKEEDAKQVWGHTPVEFEVQ